MQLISRNNRNYYACRCSVCGKEIFILPREIDKHSYKCSTCSARQNRIRYNVSRTNTSKYTFDHGFFSSGKLQADYWAGFIAADGYISKNGRMLQLKLNERDKIALDRLKQDLMYSGEVTYVKNGNTNQYRISITGSGNLCRDLAEIYNIVNAKTFTLQPPNLNDPERIRAYIVGYIDGDGTIGNSNTFKLSICSSLDLCEWIKRQMDLLFPAKNIAGNISINHNIHTYTVYGKRGLNIARYLNESPVWKLERKWYKVK